MRIVILIVVSARSVLAVLCELEFYVLPNHSSVYICNASAR